MPSAASNYLANLDFFASLRDRTDKPKLKFDKDKGLFEIASNAFVRTMGNLFSKSEEKQSVANDAMFAVPIRQVFMTAVAEGAPADRIRAALEGLRRLRESYAGEKDKWKVLNSLLDELAKMTTDFGDATADRLLQQEWNRLSTVEAVNRVLLQGETDRQSLLKLFHDNDVQTALAQVETALQSDGSVQFHPESLTDLFYRKYNATAAQAAAWISADDFAAFTKCIPYRKGVVLQGTGKTPKNRNSFIKAIQRYPKAFIYFSGGMNQVDREKHFPGERLWRVYLNVCMTEAAIDGILRFLGDKADQATTTGIVDFKISGPKEFHSRCDKVVIYLVGLSQALRLARELLKPPQCAWLQDPVPMFTQRMGPGVAVGAEPESLMTNFAKVRGLFDQYGSPKHLTETEYQDVMAEASRQSYGTIRAQLLATAAYHFVLNKKQPGFGGTENDFVRWVALTFRMHTKYLNPPGAKKARDDLPNPRSRRQPIEI